MTTMDSRTSIAPALATRYVHRVSGVDRYRPSIPVRLSVQNSSGTTSAEKAITAVVVRPKKSRTDSLSGVPKMSPATTVTPTRATAGR
jgi:hypothetical protein